MQTERSTTAIAAAVERLMETGRNLMNQGDPSRALGHFQAAAALSPGSGEAHYWAGLAHLDVGQIEQAAAALERAASLAPEHLGTRLLLAESYEALGRMDQAVEHYEAAIRLAPPDSDIIDDASRRLRYSLATRHARRGEIGAALEIFEELASEYPDNTQILYSIGVAYLMQNRLEEARAMFEKVITLEPDHANAHLNLASVYEGLEMVSEAVDSLREVIEIDPDGRSAARARVGLNLLEGRILAAEGNLPEAISAFAEVLGDDPSNRIALAALAELYDMTRQFDAALETHEQIIEYYPGHMQARLRLAELYLGFGRAMEAYEQLEHVIRQGEDPDLIARARNLASRLGATAEGRQIDQQLRITMREELEQRVRDDPEDVQAWKELARLDFQQDRHADSARALERVVKLDPDDLQSRAALASLYDRLGRFAESVEVYDDLIAITTEESLLARVTEARLLVNAKRLFVEGEHGPASKEFNKVLEQDRDNVVAHFYLGMIHAQEEEMLKAVDAYSEVIRLVPTHVGARLNLASTYEQLNQEEDAIDEYSKILQSNPPPEIEELARRRLSAAQRRMRGFSASGGYVMGYDDNTNLSDQNPVDDFRSDLSLNLAYQHKLQSGLRLRFVTAPTYSTFHKGQFDFLNTTTTASASVTPGRHTLVGGYTYRNTRGMASETWLSTMHQGFAEALTTYRLPSLTNPFSSERISSNVSLNLSYGSFNSPAPPPRPGFPDELQITRSIFSAYTTSAAVSFDQRTSDRTRTRLGYTFSINDNKNKPEGDDYAFQSHGITLGVDRFMPWGRMNLNYGFTYLDYQNPDAQARRLGLGEVHRQSTRHNIALGATYRFRRDISLFTTLSYGINRSNLPVFVIRTQEEIIQGFQNQSSSLGDYDRFSLSAGINFNF